MCWKLSKDNKTHLWNVHAPPCLLAQCVPFSYKSTFCSSRIESWSYL